MLDRALRLYREIAPPAVRRSPVVRRLRSLLPDLSAADGDVKHDAEIAYWRRQYEAAGGKLPNHWYESIFLAMAGEEDSSFLADQIVVDIGCGPRGSLCWATSARARIGVDVLADRYMELGLRDQDMVYVWSDEDRVPLPSGYADVVFTLNAMDHADDFEALSREVLRILRPGGLFVGSFNLNEPPTPAEPQTLTEDRVHSGLLRHLRIETRRTGPRPAESGVGTYHHLMDEPLDRELGSDEVGFLWVKARKPE